MGKKDDVPEITWDEIQVRMESARSDGNIFGTCIRDETGEPGCYILIMPPGLGQHIMECVRIWVEKQGYNVLGSFGPDHEHNNN